MLLEFILRNKIVVNAPSFSGPGSAGGVGDGKAEARHPAEYLVAQGGLSGAGWRGYNKKKGVLLTGMNGFATHRVCLRSKNTGP